MKEINVVELFAGVGGFRVGLQKASKKFKVVWSNQWEPSTKSQDASNIYVRNFGSKGHSNTDISKVPTNEIPDHNMLVGGFPCQDYSVARTLKQSEGLQGRKGVLWWQIYRIINEKKQRPEFLLLENVDRLLKSPVKQRGRDFAIMLASLSNLGYIVEWRVINAADYGMPQRRRRVFFLAYHQKTSIYKEINKLKEPIDWILTEGIFAETFPIKRNVNKISSDFKLDEDLLEISANFNKKSSSVSPFFNSGIMINKMVHTTETKANYDGPFTVLGNIILENESIPEEYFIDKKSLDKWKYFKGAKKEERINKALGFKYSYNEGGMVFPDALDKPSRTIITGEGGASPSRFKHVIKTTDGKFRRLTPIELERLNMFPDNHSAGASDMKRAFFMGNALVVGVIEKIAKNLIKRI